MKEKKIPPTKIKKKIIFDLFCTKNHDDILGKKWEKGKKRKKRFFDRRPLAMCCFTPSRVIFFYILIVLMVCLRFVVVLKNYVLFFLGKSSLFVSDW